MDYSMQKIYSLIVIVVMIGAQLLLSCSHPQRYSLSQMAMGTIVTVTVDAPSHEKAHNAIQAAFDKIKQIEAVMSPYKPDSDVSKINANSKTHVSKDTFTVIEQSMELSHKTNGLFDITFASIGKLWNIQSPDFIPPSPQTINTYKPCIGYQLIHLHPENLEVIKEKPCIQIGLGGIAKGYAIEQAIATLQNMGIKEAIVEAGGDLKVIGNNYGYGYTIGIKHPRKEGICGTILLFNGQSITTSGDYERFAIYKGKHYHHILNPKTGYPAKSDIISVSVIASNATVCDGYATALFIMGSKQAISFLVHNASLQLQCIIIDTSTKIYVSKSLVPCTSFAGYTVVPF